jgi:hypothetical protein
METADVFGSEIGGDDDPFAGTEFGDFEQPAAEPAPPLRPVPEAPAEAVLPVVDKEGNTLPPQPAAAGASAAPSPPSSAPPAATPSAPPAPLGTMAVPAPPAPKPPQPPPQPAQSPPAAQTTTTPPPGATPAAAAVMAGLKATAPTPGTPSPASMPSVPSATVAAGASSAGDSPSPPSPPTSPTEPVDDTTVAPGDTQSRLRAIAQREQAEADAKAAESAAGFAAEHAEPDPTPLAESAGPTDLLDVTPAAELELAKQRAEREAQVVAEPIRPLLEGDAPVAPIPADESQPEGDGIETPDELKDKKGRVTHRRYLILQPDGNGKYTEIHWWIDKDGRLVPQGTKGAKKQKHALSRGQEDALKIGYHAVGCPPRVTLIAVAESQFQPKTIEPDQPRPERTRLKIR